MYTYVIMQYLRLRTLVPYMLKDWRNTPIRECGELLVPVEEKSAYPYYALEMGISEDKRLFLREEVYEKFLKAKKSLVSRGYDLLVYDGWRSLETQEKLFWLYLKKFTVKKFNLESNFNNVYAPNDIKDLYLLLPKDIQVTLKEINRSYVSWPSDNPLRPSPHVTGGSVDVWLYKDGIPVNLGVPFDWMYKEAGAFFHLKIFRPRVFPLDKEVSFHRSLMIYSMWKAGFSCYGPEFWHFNYGNQMDALVKGSYARYSMTSP